MVVLGGGVVSYERGTPVDGTTARWREDLRANRGTSLIRKRPFLQEPSRTLGIGLWLGPRGWRFLMSEVPL